MSPEQRFPIPSEGFQSDATDQCVLKATSAFNSWGHMLGSPILAGTWTSFHACRKGICPDIWEGQPGVFQSHETIRISIFIQTSYVEKPQMNSFLVKATTTAPRCSLSLISHLYLWGHLLSHIPWPTRAASLQPPPLHRSRLPGCQASIPGTTKGPRAQQE